MHFDLKSNESFLKNVLGPIGAFYLKASFLEILKLENRYKKASSLSNVLTFLKKM